MTFESIGVALRTGPACIAIWGEEGAQNESGNIDV